MYSNRTYRLGDRVVMARAIPSATGSLQPAFAPVYSNARTYKLHEGVIVNMSNGPNETSSGTFQSNESLGSYSYLSAAFTENRRPVCGSCALSRAGFSEAVAMFGRCPWKQQASQEEIEFIRPFLLPMVVCSADYVRLVRDIRGNEGNFADVEAIAARAEQLGITFERFTGDISITIPANYDQLTAQTSPEEAPDVPVGYWGEPAF